MANINIWVLRETATKAILSIGMNEFIPAVGQEQVSVTIDSSDFSRFTTKYRFNPTTGDLEINGKTFYLLEIQNDASEHDPIDDSIPLIEIGGSAFITFTLRKKDLDGNYLTDASDDDRIYIKGTGRDAAAADPATGLERGFVVEDLGSQVGKVGSAPTNVTGVVINSASDNTPVGDGTLTYKRSIIPTNQPTNVTGVTIDSYSDDTPVGSNGSLKYTNAGTTLEWKAPDDADYGAAVNVGAGGGFALTSDDGSTMNVTVAAGSLPGGDQTDNDITTELKHELNWAANGEGAGADVNVTVGGTFDLNSGVTGSINVTVTPGSLPAADTSDNDITISLNDEFVASKDINAAEVAVIVDGDVKTASDYTIVGDTITFDTAPNIGDSVQLLYSQITEGEVTYVDLVNGVITFRVYAATDRGYTTFILSAEDVADGNFIVLTGDVSP